MRHPFRSVGAQLSLALLLVVAAALAIVYVAVVPSLEKRLVNTRVSQLKQTAGQLRPRVDQGWVIDSDNVSSAATRHGARVILVQPLLDTMLDVQDSVPGDVSSDVEHDKIIARANTTNRPQHGTFRQGGQHFAEAVVPVLKTQNA